MNKLRVVVIDDSLVIRGIIDSLVEVMDDCEVVGVAGDVEHGRELIARCNPDVVTLDLSLPGVDGMTFLDELTELDGPPVMVISSSTVKGSAISIEAIRRGASDTFDKARLTDDVGRLRKALRRYALEHRRRV
jgi:two-component system chemotaxis response regulator CheB